MSCHAQASHFSDILLTNLGVLGWKPDKSFQTNLNYFALVEKLKHLPGWIWFLFRNRKSPFDLDIDMRIINSSEQCKTRPLGLNI